MENISLILWCTFNKMKEIDKMKKIILSMVITLLPMMTFAGTKIDVTVTGMVCAFCSQGITKKFKEQKSVKEIKVDLDTKLVQIELNDQDSLDDKQITDLLKDAGYGVSKIERK